MEPDGREGDRRGDLGPNPGEGRGAPLFVAVDQQHVPAPMSEHGRDIDGEQGFADSAFDVANREDHGRTDAEWFPGGRCVYVATMMPIRLTKS